MRLHRRIGMATLLLLFAAATTALLRNPASQPSSHRAGGGDTPSPASVAAAARDASAPGENAPSGPAEAGMMAYIDPETGELTTGPAPASELTLDAELQNALRRDDAGLEVVTRADGTKVLNLQGRYQHASVIHIDENGATTVCTDHAAAVEGTLNHPPVVKPTVPEVK